MKVLNIIGTGYRATIEEQDDTIVWLSHILKGAGAELDVLLRGSAVNYCVKAQDASGLSFGGEAQTQPPQLADDVVKLIDKGAKVYVLSEDFKDRGLQNEETIDGFESINRSDLPKLFDNYQHVWHW